MKLTKKQEEAKARINKLLDAVQTLLDECTEIANKNKVAFVCQLGGLSDEYVPDGAKVKIDSEYGDEDISNGYSGYSGWQASSC